jgi:hypothetical protein
VEVGKTLADADAEFERGIDALETACSTANESGGFHYINQSAEIYNITEPLVRSSFDSGEREKMSGVGANQKFLFLFIGGLSDNLPVQLPFSDPTVVNPIRPHHRQHSNS